MLLFAIYLVLVIALPVMLSAAIGYHSLPRGHACPNCTQDTFAMQSHFIRLVRLVHPHFRLQRRWCPTCTWDGWARAYEPAPAPASRGLG